MRGAGKAEGFVGCWLFFLNKHALKSGPVFTEAYERGLCACNGVCLGVKVAGDVDPSSHHGLCKGAGLFHLKK